MTPQLSSPKDLLLPYQRRWADDKSRFKLGCMARQTGKDFSSAAEIAEDMIGTASTMWMIAAPSERQSVESLDKVKDWLRAYDVVFDEQIFELKETNFKATAIVLSNGSRCIAVPGRPDTVRGYSANLLLTEFAFFDDPEATWKAILPSVINPLRGGEKKVRIISTPNGKSGRGQRFYEILRDNYFEPILGRKTVWSCHYVTLKDAIAEGLPVNYDELVEGINDPIAVKQELDLEFIDSSNVLLPYDIIALAESVDATTACDPSLFESRGRDLRLGIDFGRTNDPTVCWVLERVGDVGITREVLVLKNMPTPEQEAILRRRIAAAQRVSFDYTGPGIGLGDYLAKEFGEWNPTAHKFGKIELCTFTQGFKRDIFPKMRRRFEAPVKLRIPIDIEVREDLHAMQQIVNNGAYSYEAPRTREGHSDRCTALALACRAADDENGPLCLPGRWNTSSLASRKTHNPTRRWSGIRKR